jgi:glycosyltransferase involved in cell wall biosynthesis
MANNFQAKDNIDHITVCICTFKRPLALAELLLSLKNQFTGGRFTYNIVVVDNDSCGSAKKVVNKFIIDHELDIVYTVEEKQNIALARNKSVLNSKGNFIAFIDDDELPNSKWLYDLFLAINKYNVDGLLGPVCPKYEIEPPKWVTRGELFDRPRHKTGHLLKWKDTRTGNVLIRKKVFEESPDWFREEFGSGGEDRDFFKRKMEEGFKFAWCNEAVVLERVPPKRWQLNVQIKRALIRGRTAANYSSDRTKTIVMSALAILSYGFSWPILFLLSPLIGYENFFKYFVAFFDHLGKLLAFFKIDLIKEKYIVT